MDSAPPESKPEFRKLSNDVATRKYRRHSPASGTSSDGSAKRGQSPSPVVARGHVDRGSDSRSRRKDDGRELERETGRHQSSRAGDSRRHYDRHSSRSSHNYSRHDDYKRYEKHADDEDRHHRVSSRHGRESSGAAHLDHVSEENDHNGHRDQTRKTEKSSHDKYDGYGHRSRDRIKDKERDRDWQDRDDQDERRDYHRSSGDHKGKHAPYHDQSRGYRSECYGREKDGHRSRELNKDREPNVMKEREQRSRDPSKDIDDQDSLSKKPKLFDFSSDVDGNRNGAEIQSSNSKHAAEIDHKTKGEQAQADTSDVASDLNAAKVAALKAAELVNKNLVGTGFMSTEQKKKLLWGNKSSTALEEAGPKWNTAMFGDRERQEKFNKLMGVKGDTKMDYSVDKVDNGGHLEAEKQKELQMDLEKQYTAGLRRRDGRTVGLGL